MRIYTCSGPVTDFTFETQIYLAVLVPQGSGQCGLGGLSSQLVGRPWIPHDSDCRLSHFSHGTPKKPLLGLLPAGSKSLSQKV